MKIVVTGGTGFIGRPLCAELAAQGHAVTVLARDVEKAQSLLRTTARCVGWGAGANDDWKNALAEADAVLNLAGEPVAGHNWTPEYKERIRSSRIDTTRQLADAMRAAERPPAVFISSSAVGYYGDCNDETVTESSLPGSDFLAGICVAWEDEARKAEAQGTRVVIMRIGVVLGPGGALEKMLHPLPLPVNPYKLGVGGPLGSGKQWMPWIHLDDVIGLFVWALTNAQVQGPVNVTAPNPVTNADFTHTLGRLFHRPTMLPVPAFALRAMLGEFAASVLTGQKALPEVAEKLGYRFRFVTLEPALRALLAK